MFKLFKSRKAQIRGIDFSLSIIIFSLTMGQILLLTNTFIDGNRSQIDFEERLEFVDSLTNQVVFNTGYGQGTQNWGAIPTSELIGNPNWNLGLSSAGVVDPYKLGRLSNNSIASLEIDYLSAQSGLNLSKNFRLEILKPIDVEITSSTPNTGSNFMKVDGFISKSAKPLFNVKIWAYVVDEIGNVGQNYTTSNSNGLFSVEVPTTFGTAMNYFIGVIAKFGHNSEGIDVENLKFGSALPLSKGKISVLNSSAVGIGNVVNVTTDMFPSAPTLLALYPGSPGGTNFSTSTLGNNTIGNVRSNNSIPIPTTGSVLFLATFSNLTDTTVAYIDFPVSLDNSISNAVQPSKIPSSDSSSRFLSIIVRGILIDVIITIWE